MTKKYGNILSLSILSISRSSFTGPLMMVPFGNNDLQVHAMSNVMSRRFFFACKFLEARDTDVLIVSLRSVGQDLSTVDSMMHLTY